MALPTKHIDDVPELGTVVVRGLKLSERFALSMEVRALQQPREGETPDQADARLQAYSVVRTLSMAVVDAAGAPVMSAEGWDDYGCRHYDHALRLFSEAAGLNGEDVGREAKNC